MSVYIQDHPEAQVEIADELESFLHVMIYCAIRYLPHTCTNVGDFMYQFFDDGVRRGEADYTCGASKRLIMQTGQLTTLWNENIIFLRRRRDPDAEPPTAADRHPIDELFKRLLEFFSARYALCAGNQQSDSGGQFAAYFNEGEAKDEPGGSRKRESQSQMTVQGLLTQLPLYIARYVRAATSALLPTSLFAAYLEDGTSRELKSRTALENRYKSIQTHSRLITMLGMASEQEASKWPGPQDRLPDQLQPEYKPNREVKTREKRTAPVGEPDEQPPSKRRCTASGRTASRVR
ncbi:hypothetical protein NUW54_g8231 [Trametes sanguinea]|uniref:Uncharacterized protein n=1 Tax=Trametes sanguinea TaxID=158606 RepID=A0ACC1PFH4_9APHY|nr:hypothetical protein NUW54_g8231 [Trametes sanguinea]